MKTMVLKKRFEETYRTLKLDDVKEELQHIIDRNTEEIGFKQTRCMLHNIYEASETIEFIIVEAKGRPTATSKDRSKSHILFDNVEAEMIFNTIMNSLSGVYGYQFGNSGGIFYCWKKLIEAVIVPRKETLEKYPDGFLSKQRIDTMETFDIQDNLATLVKRYEPELPSQFRLQVDLLSSKKLLIRGSYFQKENDTLHADGIATEDMQKLLGMIWELYLSVNMFVPVKINLQVNYPEFE